MEMEAADNGHNYTANYAYVDIQATDRLSFRAGKILVPFLSYNENKPNFKQFLMSQLSPKNRPEITVTQIVHLNP